MDTVFIRNGFYHEVGRISDIRVGTHEHRAAGNSRQHLHRNLSEGSRKPPCKPNGSRRREKYQVCRRIIEETGQHPGHPEHLKRLCDPKLGSHSFQDCQGRLHGDENSDEQDSHFLDGPPGEMVFLPDLRAGGFEG